MSVSGTTLTQSSSGQYTSAWSSVGRSVRIVTACPCQKNIGAADSFYMAARSPASSCVALMASRRLILHAKKMKCFKDDS